MESGQRAIADSRHDRHKMPSHSKPLISTNQAFGN
jgi:hypothetical protein